MMNIGRRELLKLGGGGILLTTTGYAGYQEVRGGSWLYDPGTLTAAYNKYFALVDYETLYELQEEYGGESVGEVDGPTGSSFDPAELEQVAAVGSASISGDNGVPTGLVSLAATGSFDVDPVEDAAAESPEVDELDGEYDGFTLWDAPIPDEELSAPMDSDPDTVSGAETDAPDLSLQPESAAFGTRDGAVLSSTVMAPKADIESVDGVTTMIDARDGGVSGPDLMTDDPHYESIRGQFDSSPTFLFGATLDPASVTLAVAAYQFVLGFAGGFGEAAGSLLDQWVADLRAVAAGGDVDMDAEEATVRAFLTYDDEHTARQTGIVQLLDAASTTSGARESAELNARYEGKSIVIEAEGDTETVFDPATQSPVETTNTVLESQGRSG